jgi:DNA invertase Pin-like site-specific DNA recombinase
MSVFAYCRVSTDAQADLGESLGVQQRQIEGWCHMQGLVLDEVFVERGISGSICVADRPEGKRLWARLQRGDTVVAPKLDRLFRSALDALQTVEALRERGVSLVLLDLGGDISGNGLSKFFLTIVAAFAEVERDRIRERVRQVKRDQRARNRYLGGIAPFGWRVNDEGGLSEVAEQEAAIRTMLSLRAEGASLRQIAVAMSVAGHAISHEGVASVLRNGHAASLQMHRIDTAHAPTGLTAGAALAAE